MKKPKKAMQSMSKKKMKKKMEKRENWKKNMKMPSTSFATKDYLGEFSFKTSPNKMGKPHSKSSPFKPVPEVTKKETESSPFKPVSEVTKKETVDKYGKCRKDRNFGQEDDRYGGENYKSGDRQHKGLTDSNS